MSRLTKRIKSNVPTIVLKMLGIEDVPTECVEIIKTDSDPCNSVCEQYECSECPINEAFEKLAYYEDLEEQDRLIEQKHGTWIPNKHMTRTPTAENYHCSECTQTGKTTAYCPNCGAKMELKELEGVKE